MNEMDLSSRKFIIVIYLQTVMAVALFLKMATFDQWWKVAGPLVLLYLGVNIYEKIKLPNRTCVPK